jgi:hypothetical protein
MGGGQKGKSKPGFGRADGQVNKKDIRRNRLQAPGKRKEVIVPLCEENVSSYTWFPS